MLSSTRSLFQEIPEGLDLLIESLDRLDEKAPTALRLLSSLSEKGITIVTLMDGQVYSEANITDNWTKLVVACAIMARANQESVTKSEACPCVSRDFLRKPRRRFFSSALLFALAFVAFGSSRGPIASAQVNVTTQHNDIGGCTWSKSERDNSSILPT